MGNLLKCLEASGFEPLTFSVQSSLLRNTADTMTNSSADFPAQSVKEELVMSILTHCVVEPVCNSGIGEEPKGDNEKRQPGRRGKSRVKFTFTEMLIDKLKPKKSRQRLYDAKVGGLMLEVMTSGAKIFRLRRGSQWATIGTYPRIGLDEARKQATLLSADLIKGADFTKERQEARQELTLKELVEQYFGQYADHQVKTSRNMRGDISRWFAKEFPLKLGQLTSLVLQASINRLIAADKPHAANKARNYIRSVLNWGAKNGLYAGEAARSLCGARVQSRGRIILPLEFAGLLEAIRGYPNNTIRDFFLVCLYTGARSGNVMAMRWEDVCIELGMWSIPQTKNGHGQIIGLSDAALEVLKARHKERSTPWVFPGRRVDHLVEPPVEPLGEPPVEPPVEPPGELPPQSC